MTNDTKKSVLTTPERRELYGLWLKEPRLTKDERRRVKALERRMTAIEAAW